MPRLLPLRPCDCLIGIRWRASISTQSSRLEISWRYLIKAVPRFTIWSSSLHKHHRPFQLRSHKKVIHLLRMSPRRKTVVQWGPQTLLALNLWFSSMIIEHSLLLCFGWILIVSHIHSDLFLYQSASTFNGLRQLKHRGRGSVVASGFLHSVEAYQVMVAT